VPESPPADTPGDRAYRRGFTRKRGDKSEDYAVDLFREAQAHLSDPARVNRILLELERFYNPLADGPIVPLATRRRVIELLEDGRRDEATRLLDERLALYLGPGAATGEAR
jgi:hypothetical protein